MTYFFKLIIHSVTFILIIFLIYSRKFCDGHIILVLYRFIKCSQCSRRNHFFFFPHLMSVFITHCWWGLCFSVSLSFVIFGRKGVCWYRYTIMLNILIWVFYCSFWSLRTSFLLLIFFLKIICIYVCIYIEYKTHITV